jgi:predicted RNA-binding protein with PIN domain
MRWLIDGYNVIRRDADLKAREHESLQAGRAALVALVARVARDLPDTFTVVFDGARQGGADPAPGRVQVIFSRPPASADDELRRLAVALREGAVVVSSDRAVQDATRRAGAVAISAEQFLEAVDAVSDEGDDDPDDDDADEPHRGQAHRRSRAERAAQRALRRLRNR